MAYTTFATGDSNAVKLWSKKVSVQMREKVDIGPLMGDDDESIIQIKTETSKNKGDQVKFNLRAVVTGDGFTENQRATGNGESLTYYQDTVTINELGHVVSPTSENTIDHQRVPFDPRDEGSSALSEWWATRKSVSFFNHVCGYLPANSAPYGVKYTAHNTVRAHTTSRKMWANASITADESITSSHPIVLNSIDRLLTQASLGNQQVRPVKINGQDKYVFYMHPQVAEDLQTSTATQNWNAIALAAIQGGQLTKNPLYNGSLGEYKGVILRKSQHVTYGVNSSSGAADTDVRRNVFLGAQAAVCAYTRKGNPGENKFRWTEREEDHGRLFEMGAWSIWGLSKAQHNSLDHGVITMSSYSSQ